MSISTIPPSALLFLLLPGVVTAAARTSFETDRLSVRLDGRLRSAEILHIARSHAGGRLPSPHNWDEQLARHFDAVLEILEANTKRSLRLSSSRLERHQNKTWTDVERGQWLHRLAANRRQNIANLRSYQRRRRFPKNEHQPGIAIPIFVDRHDTACAVGYLMRSSGWVKEVERISNSNNFVFVSHAVEGPVVDWVLHSGLTQEEATLVQPAYPWKVYLPRNPQMCLTDLLEPGTSLTRDGWRFDNFSFDAPQNPDVALAYFNEIGVSTFHHYGGGIWGDPKVQDRQLLGIGGFVSTGPGQSQTLSFGYDVIMEDGMGLIDGTDLVSNGSLGFGNQDGLSIVTNVYDENHLLLGSMQRQRFSEFDRSTLSFPSQRKIRLETTVTTQDHVRISSLAHRFGVFIPEPSTLTLAVLGTLVIGGARWRRKTARCQT